MHALTPRLCESVPITRFSVLYFRIVANRKLGRFLFDSEIWVWTGSPACELCARLARVFGFGKAPF